MSDTRTLQVEDFQPYYIFDKERMTDLCIGNAILSDRLKEEQIRLEKEEKAQQRALAEKALMNEKV